MELFPGLTKSQQYTIKEEDIASFNGQVVHRVCSTFVLAREVEWATRQYVLDVLQPGQEGIGTQLTIDHEGPAFPGEVLTIDSRIESWDRGQLLCSFKAHVAGRPVASGKTGQRIMDKMKLAERFMQVRAQAAAKN